MRIVLVHLSDIHIKTSTCPVLARSSQIADAVQNLDYDAEAALVVVTGDVAYSGQSDQYELALAFLGEIAEQLRRNMKTAGGRSFPVHLAVVPGNHDCLFPEDKARAVLKAAVVRDAQKGLDDSFITPCTAVQSNYFAFSHKLMGLEGTEPSTARRKLFSELVLHVGPGQVRLLLCNTSWLSTQDEKQGTLSFPADVLPEQADGDLTISLMHHPFNWLEANAGKALRKRVEGLSDIILTGHEHESTWRSQFSRNGDISTHVEGGVLQLTDGSQSTFNVLVVDTTKRTQHVRQLEYSNDRYVVAIETEHEFKRNPARSDGFFSHAAAFAAELNDPGVILTHRTRGRLGLRDVFVYPDLVEIKYKIEKLTPVVDGDSIVNVLLAHPLVLITGDGQSGKTSLCKAICQDLLERGTVPLLLTGGAHIPKPDRIYSFLEREVEHQFGKAQLEGYKQLERSKRAIIVDDFDKVALTSSDRRALISNLCKFSGSVVLVANDVTLDLSELIHPDSETELRRYGLLPFGFVRRSKLIERWLRLGGEHSQGAFLRELDRLTATLDSLLGKNFVPSYPINIVSVLQAAEASTPIDTKISAQGYFYELLIKSALERARGDLEFDILSSYLAHLAMAAFEAGSTSFDIALLKKHHQAFEDRYDLHQSLDDVTSLLTACGILQTSDGETIRFKYRYIYYFFLATYLRDRLGESVVKAHIVRMSQTLHMEESANVVLFLSHLTRDPFILNSMLSAAKTMYVEFAPAALDRDVEFLDIGQAQALEVVYEERDVREARKAKLQALDAAMAKQPAAVQLSKQQLEPLLRMSSALKTIQILGQLLKNFPGSIEAPQKVEVVETCYHLGLRCLTAALKMLHENEREVMREVVEFLVAQSPGLGNERIARKARETIVGLGALSAMGMVKRLSVSLGSPAIVATYEKVRKKTPDVPAIALIDTAIRLDRSDAFPSTPVEELAEDLDKKPIALWVLKGLVVEHFGRYEREYRLKQRICEKLHIQYKKLAGGHRKKLAGRKR